MMEDRSHSQEAKRISRLASEYRKKGYTVTLRPSPKDLPKELSGLQPDLIATCGDDKVLVEVKTSKGLATNSQLTALTQAAEEVGWRFELVVIGGSSRRPFEGDPLGSPEIRARAFEAIALEEKHPLAAFLLAWSALEAAARQSLRSYPASTSTSSLRLLKTVYSMGGLNESEITWIQEFAALRSRLSHGISDTIPSGAAKRAADIAVGIVVREELDWETEVDDSE